MPKSPVRTVVYPRVGVIVCGSPDRTGISDKLASQITAALANIAPDVFAIVPPMTSINAETLLGWEEESDTPFGDEYDLLDRYKRKVRLTKNTRNRHLTPASYEAYCQDFLNDNWELNGETIIVGDDGVLLNGQNTLVGLKLAQQDRDRLKDMTTGEYRWATVWPDGVVRANRVVFYGTRNIDRVVNTMDTCKPRSLADVLYRSPYFADLPKSSPDRIDRNTAAKVCDAAIRTMWLRTGMKIDDLNPRMTHSEATSFLDTHKSLLKCVRHLLDNGERVRKYLPVGYSSAMMYLMAVSVSDDEKYYGADDRREKYYGADDRREKLLDLSMFDLAKSFWEEFGSDGALTDALDALVARYPDGNPPLVERDYLVCVAWNKYVTGKAVTPRDFTLDRMYTDPDPKTGFRSLKGNVTVGGIDLGTSKLTKHPDEGSEPPADIKDDIENGIDQVNEDRKEATEPPKDMVPTVEEARQRLHTENPTLGPILMRNALKKWVLYEFDAQMFGKSIDRKPKLTPSNLLAISLTVNEAEAASDVWVKEGREVGFATELNGVWSIDRIDRPAKTKGRTKK